MADWQNRIIRHDNVSPADLVPHPMNFRLHPAAQEAALLGLVKQVGWVDDVLVNTTTNRILDGHLRVELALKNGEPTVPVKYVSLTEEEELLVLSTFDPITGMAEMDTATLAALLGQVALTPVEDEGVAALLATLAAASGAEGLQDDEEGAAVAPEAARATLAERFIIPPFSVLDARQGYWQARKRAWIALGIQSELGRGEALTYADDDVVS